jgi:hypothetical protein
VIISRLTTPNYNQPEKAALTFLEKQLAIDLN